MLDALPRPPSADAPRIFTGIAHSYDRVGALLSLGQDPRWRHALVNAVGASPEDVVLDVATGTGLVAVGLARQYGCRVVGVDRSADMLTEAARRNGLITGLVNGRAERLPFADATFDHVTFTYLLRYVDDPAATVSELARVLKRGGRLASLEFGVPSSPWTFALWRLYTRLVMPLAGSLVSRKWREVNAFLGPSIERFYLSHPQREVERYWREAGLGDVRTRRMSLGGGIVMSATKRDAPAASDVRLGSAFYALRPGGWRDYWTLLHPPYTAWHLSYVVLGAALAPAPDPRIVLGALLAFGLCSVRCSAYSSPRVSRSSFFTRSRRRWCIQISGSPSPGAPFRCSPLRTRPARRPYRRSPSPPLRRSSASPSAFCRRACARCDGAAFPSTARFAIATDPDRRSTRRASSRRPRARSASSGSRSSRSPQASCSRATSSGAAARGSGQRCGRRWPRPHRSEAARANPGSRSRSPRMRPSARSR
ncbi:MAG: methyltransferase domain-containing protein [Chloroflexi bacterium]|nr:MAG: methyltransferase domain-containing protein [Chloroflexota bacterium]